MQTDRKAPAGMPRWVKVFGIVVIVLILFVLVAVIIGIGGSHGPGRHMPAAREEGATSYVMAHCAGSAENPCGKVILHGARRRS
jgi:hypothetical protein